MDAPSNGGRDSRFNLGNFEMSEMPVLSSDSGSEIYNSNILHSRPPSITTGLCRSSISPLTNSCVSGLPRGVKRPSEMCYDPNMSNRSNILSSDCNSDIMEDKYSPNHQKNSPLSNGKKTKGRVKIKMEYIDNKLRRYTTFSKRKTGIMKKAYELSTLTGTQVMLLVASETGHVYTFATRKLQPMITSEAGKALIQTCLNSPDPCPSGSGDQRMSATGFEETELSYNIGDDEKVRQLVYGGSPHSHLSGSHQLPHQNPHHQQHLHPHQHTAPSPHMLNMSHPHAQSPPSHLIPCSSPSPMLASTGGYHPHPSCSSPLPHSMYPPHIPHSHTQR